MYFRRYQASGLQPHPAQWSTSLALQDTAVGTDDGGVPVPLLLMVVAQHGRNGGQRAHQVADGGTNSADCRIHTIDSAECSAGEPRP